MAEKSKEYRRLAPEALSIGLAFLGNINNFEFKIITPN
jgi:hypothetical protein